MALNLLGSSSQHLTTPSAPVSAVPITMACLFRADSNISDGILLSLNSTTGTFDRLVLVATANFGAPAWVAAQSVAAGSPDTVLTTAGYTAGTWAHAAGVYQTNNKTAYLNAANAATSAAAYSVTGIDSLIIGGRRNAGGVGIFYSGLIAEVGIWAAALTVDEIASLSKGFTPDQVRPQSLRFYAPLVRLFRDLRGGLTINSSGAPQPDTHPRVYA